MKIRERLKEDLHLPGFVADVLFVVVVVGTISIISELALGLWTPMVAVESGSMIPNLNIGDIVVVQGASRTQVVTWEEAESTGYKAFNLPGDVILYRPYGKERLSLIDQGLMLLGIPSPPDKATPIIHRALRWVEKGQPMWEGGPPAPVSGYITKGDHNSVIDQRAGRVVGVSNDTYLVEGISYLTPVKKEWVIGVARLRIPLVGYVRLIPNLIAEGINRLFRGY
jgi:signal peptidase